MKKKQLIIGCVVVAVALVFGAWGLQKRKEPKTSYEQSVDKITEIDPKDRQQELNDIVKDGEINIQYSMGAVFDGTESEVFNVKNIENNKHPLVFTIYDEKEQVLYESEEVALGYEVNRITLAKELPKGTHDCRIKIGYAREGNVSSTFPITIEVN